MRYSALLLLVLTSCVAKPIISTTACNDPLYLKLKQEPIDSMTDREFAYFMTKDRECEQAWAESNAVTQLEKSAVAKPIIRSTACNDSLYLTLLDKPIESMTSRQFAYFQAKDQECENARASSNAIKQFQTGQLKTGLLLLIIDGVLVAAMLAFAPWRYQ